MKWRWIIRILGAYSQSKIENKPRYTPLNILNGTPEGVPLDVSKATLPINQLKSTVIFDDRSNSNVHRCKIGEQTMNWLLFTIE